MRVKPGIILFCLLFASLHSESHFNNSIKEAPSAGQKLSVLTSLYYHWSENFYGADRYYRSEILNTLNSYRNEEFYTPLILCKIYFDQAEDGVLYTVFLYENWFEMVLPSHEEQVKEFLSSVNQKQRIFGMQLTLKGIVDHYKVAKVYGKRSVRIYLRNVEINYLKAETAMIK